MLVLGNKFAILKLHDRRKGYAVSYLLVGTVQTSFIRSAANSGWFTEGCHLVNYSRLEPHFDALSGIGDVARGHPNLNRG